MGSGILKILSLPQLLEHNVLHVLILSHNASKPVFCLCFCSMGVPMQNLRVILLVSICSPCISQFLPAVRIWESFLQAKVTDVSFLVTGITGYM
jgi:hypothetical protein